MFFYKGHKLLFKQQFNINSYYFHSYFLFWNLLAWSGEVLEWIGDVDGLLGRVEIRKYIFNFGYHKSKEQNESIMK